VSRTVLELINVLADFAARSVGTQLKISETRCPTTLNRNVDCAPESPCPSVRESSSYFQLEPFHYSLLPSSDERTVPLKNGVVWDVTPCGSCKNRRFGGT
jgi:hypothetical protein